ncbi:MAG: FIST N-terminal domain-containing protein [Pseudomonadota bacterium]
MRDDHVIGPKYVCVGQAVSSGAVAAVREAMAAIDTSKSCFILAFIPAGLDVHLTVEALNVYSDGVPIFGCTTAGQITPNGYETNALMLLAFPKNNFRCASILFDPLSPFDETEVALKAQRGTARFRHTAGWNRLGLIFSDGVSTQEDVLISTLETVLDDFPIFGGSAGDGLKFEETFVLQKGRAYKNAAVLLLIETNLRFQGLGFDHFLPKGSPLVITGADPDKRLVYEINGSPAALEYARLVGCDVKDLSPQVFAENPLLLELNEKHYVRAISDATDCNALSFLAAIDDGLIMTLGEGQEILETLENGLDLQDKADVPPDFILGFDCVLRKLEIEQKQLQRPVSEILSRRRVLGFNTFGEQQFGLHMNQTFVGIAFFAPDGRALF